MTEAAKTLRDVLLAFMRVHILHHAGEKPIFGLEMMDELKRHGYAVGPGTLYPLLHGLEQGGLLASRNMLVNGKGRRYYRTTRAGDAALARLREKMHELLDETCAPPRMSSARKRR